MMSPYTKSVRYRDYVIQRIAGSYALYRGGHFVIEMPTMKEACEWIDENS